MTGFINPYYCFGFIALWGPFIAYIGYKLDPKLDNESDDVNIRSFFEELRHNYNAVKGALKVPAQYKILIYYMLLGFTVPSYVDYYYFYVTGIMNITQFEWALVNLFAYILVLITVVLYNKFFKNREARLLFKGIQCIQFLGAFNDFILVNYMN